MGEKIGTKTIIIDKLQTTVNRDILRDQSQAIFAA